MSQPSAHRIYLQQSTKEKVEVLHYLHHMCLWISRRNHGTHVTVLPTRNPKGVSEITNNLTSNYIQQVY